MLLTCISGDTNRTCSYSNSIENSEMQTTLEQLKQRGISDESCNNWHSNDKETCNNLARCKDCANGENIHNEPNCFSRDFHSYKLESFADISYEGGLARKVANIRADLIKSLNDDGPVICNLRHSKKLFKTRNEKEEIFMEDHSIPADYFTWVTIVGYIDAPASEDENAATHLWVIKLSFGDNVGYYGYIYLDASEGFNDLNILSNCFSLKVNPKVIVEQNSDQKYANLLKPMIREEFDIRKPRFQFSHYTTPMKADDGVDTKNEDVKDDPLTTPIFWGNYKGRNYLTWIKNQHIPTYCGSCWAQSATSVLTDRLNIRNINAGNSFPRHVLSVQAMINCRLGGTCLGGASGLAWELSKNWKIPTDTCRMYESSNPENFSCEGESRCFNASKDDSWEIKDFNGISVQEWIWVRGTDAIKKELLNGPISCSFEVTDKFEKYTPTKDQINVYEEKKNSFALNHAVSVVGWDKDDKGDYWIVRNSWGVEYGYNGMFYFRVGNQLGMEAQCQAPTEFTFSSYKD